MDNTLNLITPLFRSGMLQKMKSSIPDEIDVNWIIVISKERAILIHECETLGLPYLLIDEPDVRESIPVKINKGIHFMKKGFFQGLDDDTTFNGWTNQTGTNTSKMLYRWSANVNTL